MDTFGFTMDVYPKNKRICLFQSLLYSSKLLILIFLISQNEIKNSSILKDIYNFRMYWYCGSFAIVHTPGLLPISNSLDQIFLHIYFLLFPVQCTYVDTTYLLRR